MVSEDIGRTRENNICVTSVYTFGYEPNSNSFPVYLHVNFCNLEP